MVRPRPMTISSGLVKKLSNCRNDSIEQSIKVLFNKNVHLVTCISRIILWSVTPLRGSKSLALDIMVPGVPVSLLLVSSSPDDSVLAAWT